MTWHCFECVSSSTFTESMLPDVSTLHNHAAIIKHVATRDFLIPGRPDDYRSVTGFQICKGEKACNAPFSRISDKFQTEYVTCCGAAPASTTHLVQRKTGKAGMERENLLLLALKLSEVLKCRDDL